MSLQTLLFIVIYTFLSSNSVAVVVYPDHYWVNSSLAQLGKTGINTETCGESLLAMSKGNISFPKVHWQHNTHHVSEGIRAQNGFPTRWAGLQPSLAVKKECKLFIRHFFFEKDVMDNHQWHVSNARYKASNSHWLQEEQHEHGQGYKASRKY
jgi:hypothetical protein